LRQRLSAWFLLFSYRKKGEPHHAVIHRPVWLHNDRY
jgi:hypothetical protein